MTFSDQPGGGTRSVAAINWVIAAYGGAALGGVTWAAVARLAFDSDGDLRTAGSFWMLVACACVVGLLLGSALAVWAPTVALKTLGVAVALAPVTGAVLVLFIRLLFLADSGAA